MPPVKYLFEGGSIEFALERNLCIGNEAVTVAIAAVFQNSDSLDIVLFGTECVNTCAAKQEEEVTGSVAPLVCSCLSIGEFFVTPAIAEVANQFRRFGEFAAVAEHAGAVKVDVGEEERHRAALGDLLGFG